MIQVLKFGGTSVANAENINKVVAIVGIQSKKARWCWWFQHWAALQIRYLMQQHWQQKEMKNIKKNCRLLNNGIWKQ